jgi:hypothetical protein
MDSIKMIELLNKKIVRETKIRKVAEALLEQKSTELYYAKLLVEDSLVIVKKQAQQKENLRFFTKELETILLTYNSQLLQTPPSTAVIYKLLSDLTNIENIKAVRFSTTLKVLEKKVYRQVISVIFMIFQSRKTIFNGKAIIHSFVRIYILVLKKWVNYTLSLP